MDVQYGIASGNLAQRNFIYDGRSRLWSVHDSTRLTGGTVCEGPVDQDNGGTLCGGAPTPIFNARDSVAYSAVGNISYLNTPTVTGTPVYSRNRLKDWPRQGGTFSYVVDTAGFRTRVNKGTTPWTFYRWTPDGLLDTVRVGAGSNVVRRIKYDYNAFGELVRRSIDGTVDRHFLWDRGNLLAELNGTLTARRSEYAHFPGLDAPFALLTGATTVAEVLMVQRDPLGNVLGLTTTAGAVKTDQLGTSQWGALFTSPTVNDTTTMRLRWKGMMYEADSTQLYYVRARWYDPQTRRFISEDPIGIEGGINPYTFGDGDPVNHSDPEGLDWECVDQMVWVFGFETSVEWHTKCTSKGAQVSWKGILGNVLGGMGEVWGDGGGTGGPGWKTGQALGLITMALGVRAPLSKLRAPGLVDPLAGTTYTPKVLAQMNGLTPDWHTFPRSADGFARLGTRTLERGADGLLRTHIKLPGSWQGYDGYFHWIIEKNGTINHRIFVRNVLKS